MLKYAEIIVKVEKKRIQSLKTLYTGPADGFSYGQSFELWGDMLPDHHCLTYYPYNPLILPAVPPKFLYYTQFSGLSMITWGVVSKSPQDYTIQSSFLGLKGGTCRALGALSTTQPVSLRQEVNEKHETLEKTLAKEEDKPGGSLMAALSPYEIPANTPGELHWIYSFWVSYEGHFILVGWNFFHESQPLG